MNILIIMAVIFALLVVFGIVALLLQKKQAIPAKQYDATEMMMILKKNNINTITYVRNKIVIEFINVDFFNPEELQECGAKGISIVGDKIKFYVDGTNEDNEMLFQQLKQHIEG